MYNFPRFRCSIYDLVLSKIHVLGISDRGALCIKVPGVILGQRKILDNTSFRVHKALCPRPEDLKQVEPVDNLFGPIWRKYYIGSDLQLEEPAKDAILAAFSRTGIKSTGNMSNATPLNCGFRYARYSDVPNPHTGVQDKLIARWDYRDVRCEQNFGYWETAVAGLPVFVTFGPAQVPQQFQPQDRHGE
ncbi:uncharacterized protein JCM15063_003127 [Sporobolomyces koalae]|uniref:uncharacterized protein n=1 Tax=Sporobolomyces koalae TaxID=500713 RepID=UPI00316DFDA1